MATNVTKDPGKAEEERAKFGSSPVSRNTRTAFSTIPVVFNFYHTGKGLSLGKLVQWNDCYKYYPSAPLEPLTNFEDSLEKRTNGISSFNGSIKS